MNRTIYIIEMEGDSIYDIHETEDIIELEEMTAVIESEGHEVISLSQDYIDTLVDECVFKWGLCEAIYEDVIIRTIGTFKWEVLKYLGEVVYVTTLNKKRLYAF